MKEFLAHLTSRHLDERLNVFIDFVDEVVTFPLYDTSSKLTGILKYNWKGGKKHTDKVQKYVPVVPKGNLACYGLDNLNPQFDTCFLVEGVFDAVRLHSLGHNAVAVLCNNPKYLTPVLQELNEQYNLVALCDGDDSGQNLAKYAPTAIHLPEGEDPASFPHLRTLLRSYD